MASNEYLCWPYLCVFDQSQQEIFHKPTMWSMLIIPGNQRSKQEDLKFNTSPGKFRKTIYEKQNTKQKDWECHSSGPWDT
jgi:hypothetical protein